MLSANDDMQVRMSRMRAEQEARRATDEDELKAFVGLRYEHMRRPAMERHVPAFLFFDSMPKNDAFLEMLNLKHSEHDPGILTRLVRYKHATWKFREGAPAPCPSHPSRSEPLHKRCLAIELI